ncbi:MAG: hypothetical protein BGO95_04555 [Micrococcales bacterium 73-13]|nr:MAG: hypothetical protein BGO95_04555 [Micrococcales bacterium 73-13]
MAGEQEQPSREAAGRRTSPRRRPSILLWVVLVVMLGLVGAPIVTTFIAAFASGTLGLPKTTFSLDAIWRTYFSGELLWPLIATLLLSVLVAALAVGIGAAAAWVVSRTDLPRRGLFELAIISPIFVTPFIGTIAWLVLASPRAGMINVNLRWMLGTDATFVDIMTLPGIIAIMVLFFVPYAYLLVSSALKNMDPSLEEASLMNGRGTFATMFKVTFPIARPALVAAFFFIAVLATGTFTVPQLLGVDMGFQPLAVKVYRAVTATPADPAFAAAVGTLMFWFTLAGMYFYRRAIKHANRYVTVGARGTRPRLVRLRWVKAPIILLFTIYVLLAVVLPYAALILISFAPYSITDLRKMELSFDNFFALASAPDMMSAIVNTLLLGLIVPTVTVLIGLAVGYVVNRERGRVAAFVEYLATLPLAIPGIVFALGVVMLYIRTPLYATLPIIVIGLVGVFIPHAVRFASNGIMQIDRSLEEAARMSGAGKLRMIGTITVPLLRPALLSAWILLFIIASREVNETVLLASVKTRPLAVIAWNFLSSGTIQQAAAGGLLLSVFMLVAVLVARFVFRTKVSAI